MATAVNPTKPKAKSATPDTIHAQCAAALETFLTARAALVKLREETNNSHWSLLEQVNTELEKSL